MMKATGQTQIDPQAEVVRIAARPPFGLKDEWIEIPFVLLEVACLTSRQVMLAKQGIQVQQGVLPQPNGKSAPVPQIGSPVKGTERN